MIGIRLCREGCKTLSHPETLEVHEVEDGKGSRRRDTGKREIEEGANIGK